MNDTTRLPDFEAPPLIEVVHGVQFKPLNLSIIHPAQFYERIANRYPEVQTREPLPPVREVFGSAALMQNFSFEMLPAGLPRAWFISRDNAHLVQMQRDRLLYNWRLAEGGAAYPRYATMRAEFLRLYSELQELVLTQELGTIEPDQVEMTYISHFLSRVADNKTPDPASVLRLWSGNLGPEWSSPLEDINFGVRYRIPGNGGAPVGRVYASLATLSQSDGRRILQLDLTARGAPLTPDWSGVAMFLEIAHEHIVRCFAGITTPAAHEAWRRK